MQLAQSNGESRPSRVDIIRWWSSAVFHCNFYVGLMGIATWLLAAVGDGAAVRSGKDFEEWVLMILGPILWAMIASFCYTLAWIADVVLYRGSPRRGIFKAGLIGPVLLTGLPGILAVVAWLFTVFIGQKL